MVKSPEGGGGRKREGEKEVHNKVCIHSSEAERNSDGFL